MSDGHGEKMARKQEEAIAALLTHPTIESAASAVGIGEKTLRRWMKDPAFRAEYRAARRQSLEQATAQLQQLSSSAANALREVIEDSGVPHASRVAASKAVFEIAQRAVEVEDLADRVAMLEAAANKSDQEHSK